ncbi:transcriptional regulator NanR [Geminicoccus harenae]|uniref:transcriptional regulator NanR n=1 Tax=Geminicoccus harenae TaxID=2498453 RepID=UPI00168AAF41|nr:transcriptional regulator NanR [Geminicoccus harenae]
MTNDHIVRRKLSDEVFDRLAGMITSGEIGTGETLPSERVLMERFGVGRPAIREAMQALANLGLIQISHGERAKVREITARSLVRQVDLAAQLLLNASPTNLDHLKQARRFFERGMVRSAAEQATPEDIVQLRDALAAQRREIGNVPAFIRADMLFHRQITRISGNPIFEAVSEAMLSWLQAHRTDLLIWPGNEEVTLREHAEIIDRIAAHDAEGAEAAMVRHLDRSADLYGPRPTAG